MLCRLQTFSIQGSLPMLYFNPPLACPVPQYVGRAVCVLTPWPDQGPGLNELSYADVLTNTDFAEALAFIALAAVLVSCGARAVVRGLMLYRTRRDSEFLFARIANALYLNQRAEAFSLLTRTQGSSLARVVCAALDGTRGGGEIECSDGSVSWARNLAAYVETRKWRRGLWELNAAACIAPLIAMLFGWYIINASGFITAAEGLSQVLEVLAFSMCMAVGSFSFNLWLSSAANELCESLDRFSTVIVERLLTSQSRARTIEGIPPTAGAITMPLDSYPAHSLVNPSPFTLLHLNG